MAVINSLNVYNHILTSYGQNKGASTRYDSHKKSDLRGLYNRIVKTNKNSPLYKLKMEGDDVTKFAIDLKENARRTENLISSLTVDGDDIENVFHKKIAMSSDEDSVSVEYIGAPEDEPSTPSFELGVKALAKPQVNTGNFLDPKAHSFEPGSYTFDLDTPSNSYEFQFNVLDKDTNLDVQNRIARLINTSDVSLNASILHGDRGTTALSIASRQTGLAESEKFLFKISSGSSWNEMDLLGIDKVTSPASNSIFTLNGTEHNSLSNTFTINKDFEITLKNPTREDASIGFKTNTEAIGDSIEDMAKAFNSFLNTGSQYEALGGYGQLSREVNGIYQTLESELSKVGITTDANGRMMVDRAKLAQTVTSSNSKETFATLNRFKDALLRQAQKTAVSPMDYVEKVAVEYKNPGKTFTAPYATSRFAGMLVDRSL